MFKLFSVEEATELLPFVDAQVRAMQEALAELQRLRTVLQQTKSWSVEAYNISQESNFLMRDIQSSKAELDRLGVFLSDIEKGTVDFPSQLGAEVVCLSWLPGEKSINYYHRLNEAAQTRHPLSSSMPQPHNQA